MTLKIGIDVGGTFTDFVVARDGAEPAIFKSLSTPEDPAIAVVNGLCPYLGFKTESTFSMFANLRTECGRGNHLLVPDGTQLTDWLQDEARVVACSDPEVVRLRDEGYGITYFQLRVLRTRAKRPFTATFVRGGETFEFDSARAQTWPALPRVPWIAAKLCQFRPVDLGEKVRARH